MRRYKVLTYQSLTGDLINSWRNLWQKAQNQSYYNSYEWFLVCLAVYKISEYKIYCCYKDNELVAIFPTVKRRKFAVNVISCPGDQYIDLAPLLLKIYDFVVVKLLIETMVKDGNLYLVQIDSKNAHFLKKMLPQGLASIISLVPFIDIREDPFRDMSGDNKRKLGSLNNKYKDNLTHLFFSTKGDLKKYFKVMVAIDQKSSKKLKSRDLFSKEENVELYETMIEKSAQNIRIDLLFYKDIPIAYVFAIVFSKRYLAINTAYLSDYKKLSPGKLLFYHIIKNLQEEGYEHFSFGLGHSRLKEEFTKRYQLQFEFYYSKNFLIMLWWKMINLLRRFRILLIRTQNSDDYLYLFKRL